MIVERKLLFVLTIMSALLFQRAMPCNAMTCMKQVKTPAHDCCGKTTEKAPEYKATCCQDPLVSPSTIATPAPILSESFLAFSDEVETPDSTLAEDWELSHPPPLEIDFISPQMRSLQSVNLLI